MTRAIALLFAVLLTILATVWVIRGIHARAMPELQVWHTYEPVNEFRAGDYPDGLTLDAYRRIEERLAREMQIHVYDRLPAALKGRFNRYYRESLVYAGGDGRRWNQSFELPVENPKGGILLLHGASDSPYSVRALADLFHGQGFYVLALRLPGHGTIPGGLKHVRLEDWTAVTRMGAETVAKKTGDGKTGNEHALYIAGYSAGAALALDYTLDALTDPELVVPDRLFLYSPAVGITSFARFSSWDVWLSGLPYFEKFAWMSIEPEYDPYKYNSFAKNAGHLTFRLTKKIHGKIKSMSGSDAWQSLPPVLSFQSVADSTVRTDALVNTIYGQLPDNGSELVLFDINRAHDLQFLVTDVEHKLLRQLNGDRSTKFDYTLVTNTSDKTHEVSAIRRPVGATVNSATKLARGWPPDVYSMSHVAVPFASTDPWYGTPADGRGADFLSFSTAAPRGETGLLTANLNKLMRLRHNPFFDYLAVRTLRYCEVCDE